MKTIYNMIQNFTNGKKHIKFTIGFVSNGKTNIQVFGEQGEIKDSPTLYYEIGSITKTFTSSLLAKYIYEKKMTLNDSIQTYINSLPTGYYPTLRRLATHTSGYSALLPFTFSDFLKTLIGFLISGGIKNNPLTNKIDHGKMIEIIGSSCLKDKDYPYMYSNFGYGIIGYILGMVSNRSYWDTMNDFIKNDLGLNDTYLGINLNKNIYGYDRWGKNFGNWLWNDIDLFAAAGGISSTGKDLLRYAQLNMLEEKPYLSLCYNKYASATKKEDIGLGWDLPINSKIVCKDGGTGYFSSFLGFDTDKKNIVVVLSNYTCFSINKIGHSLLNYLAN